MSPGWSAKDLSLLAVEVSRMHRISHDEIMSMNLKSGTKISYVRKNGSESMLDYLWKYNDEESKTRFKLCLMETQFKNCTDGAVDNLLLLLPTASKESQATIFIMFYKLATKYKVHDEKVLCECRAYIHITFLRQPILKTLIAYSLSRADLVFKIFTYEEVIEMSLFDPKGLSPEDPRSIRLVKRIFSNMDKASFKYSKRILRDMDERLFLYLPDRLSSTGYSHLRELIRELSPDKIQTISKMTTDDSVIRLFLPLKMDDVRKFFTYKDIDVRIESVRHINNVELMEKFLEVNQFIYGRSMLKLLCRYFRSWLKKGTNEKHRLSTMHSEVVAPMVRSRNTSRRLLGVYLMDSFISEGIIEAPGCAQLLFDSDYEIRKVGCKYSGISLSFKEMSTKIESYQSYDVDGCVEYIKSYQPKGVVSTLKKVFDSKMADIIGGKKGMEEVSIHGFLNLFSGMRYDIGACVDVIYKCCFEKLSNDIYGKEYERLRIYCKNMNECCKYYYSMALDSSKSSLWRLVEVLLHINHLGVILQVSQYLNAALKSGVLGRHDLLEIIDMSFNRVKDCKVSFRRSGGIPLLFAAILKSCPFVIDNILEKLFELINRGDNATQLHCLNILSRIIDDGCLSSKIPFKMTELFKLAFRCSRSHPWAIRNAGIEIFSHLVRKVFVKDSECIASMAYKELRGLLYKELSSCYSEENNVLAFLILHLYGRIKKLDKEEVKLVRRFSSKSGVIGSKSKNICEGKEWTKPGQPEGQMAFDHKLSEGEILLRLLILLDSEHAGERRMAERYMKDTYKLSLHSEEYFKHRIAERICSIGYRDIAIQGLRKYNLSVEKSLSCFFRDSPSNERFDFEYNMSLMQKYKN
ncbi:hypothetical protein EROM_091660 [Encephalitozoon romaleae SJ-2008]|uniref:DUF2428 domain-containing protein n=1 Tax=Encephalitozoon romaleae (strain SJ-2008) TaxID=1178016 RepID=I7ATJ4_ENCRO|nr:hypothetical protein EROM_091660 [Encephalitozoon romaleae SJ-2008]AFN83782.1 hypothetical protein EROM_091660 [Encephalitozoon romaleae SJ-2008]